MQEVLDAMFERQVEPEEFIIHQGEDGDNFYVIERFVFAYCENVWGIVFNL